MSEMLEWMYWIPETAIALSSFFAFLLFLGILSLRIENVGRKGFLPMETTLGDRVFVSFSISLIEALICLKLSIPIYFWLLPAAVSWFIILKYG